MLQIKKYGCAEYRQTFTQFLHGNLPNYRRNLDRNVVWVSSKQY